METPLTPLEFALRLQTSDSEHEHEQEQERCIRASLFVRHSPFACHAVALAKAGASSFVCPLLLCPSCRKQPPARSRSMFFAASPRFRSSDRPKECSYFNDSPSPKTNIKCLLARLLGVELSPFR